MIGPNGAGKTSTLNAISGLVAHRGSITFDGVESRRLGVQGAARRGLIQVPEGRHVFPTLSVHENLQVGETARRGRATEYGIDEVYELFPPLVPLRNRDGWALSGGEQQMVALGRALVAGPRLLLLDEPSLGLAPIVTRTLFAALDGDRGTHADPARRAEHHDGVPSLHARVRDGGRTDRAHRHRRRAPRPLGAGRVVPRRRGDDRERRRHPHRTCVNKRRITPAADAGWLSGAQAAGIGRSPATVVRCMKRRWPVKSAIAMCCTHRLSHIARSPTSQRQRHVNAGWTEWSNRKSRIGCDSARDEPDEPDRVLRVREQRRPARLGVQPDDRVVLGALGVVARVDGHPGERVVQRLHLGRVRVDRAVHAAQAGEHLAHALRQRFVRQLLVGPDGVAASTAAPRARAGSTRTAARAGTRSRSATGCRTCSAVAPTPRAPPR